jgi:lysophospholipase L1-like esterase
MRGASKRGPLRRASGAALCAVMITATGCGGGGQGITAPQGAKPREGRPTVVAALGDSITAGSPRWDPDPAVRARIRRPDERSQYEYWTERADPNVELRNCGRFGERTFEIAARLDECARGADAVVVQGGINDIAQALAGGREEEASALYAAARSLRETVRRAKDMGLRVAIADVLPWNNGPPLAARTIEELNRRIHAIARAEGVPLLPFNRTLADPGDPTRMRAEWTADGDHPSIDGYRRLGERAFRAP